MVINLPKLSKWQALFRNFEGAVWDSDLASFRTQNIMGINFENPAIAKDIAIEISGLVELRDEHYSFKRERMAVLTTEKKTEEISDEDFELIEAQLAEIRGTEEIKVISETPKSELDIMKLRVDPSQIELKEITSESTINAHIFPLSFRCNKCGHFEIADPETTKKLECPCCFGYCPKCEEEIDDASKEDCPKCGTKLTRKEMEQFSYVFACPRCANLEEFTPTIERLQNIRGAPIQCPKCKKGHLHFWIKDSFQTARWFCSNQKCDYNERLNKFCKCHIRKGLNDEKGRPSIMKPTVTSASSIAYPLIRSYLYMGASHITLQNLLDQHEKTKSIDPYAWKLGEKISELDMKMISEIYGILDAYTVPKITTTTVVYGYKSGISSHPIEIKDNERMAGFFEYGRKFRAYVVNTEGRGLVIKINKEKLMSILRLNFGYSEKDTYDKISEDTINYLNLEKFQFVLENPKNVPLVTILHAIEHAFFKCVMDLTGLEVFGSKILIKDCAIILYEREDVGAGGLLELTPRSDSAASEFKKYLRIVKREIMNCSQLCKDSCPACIFINDFYCQPFMPNEITRWYPPNAILDRVIANKLFEVHEEAKKLKSG